MTFRDGAYQVTGLVTIPSDTDTDGYTATRMWMRHLANLYREAAKAQPADYYFVAREYRKRAETIHEAMDILEDDHGRR